MAKFYLKPKNTKDFISGLRYAKKNNLDIHVMGNGSKTLICDTGYYGLIIHKKSKKIKIQITNKN